jgi:hypothetical protein
MLHCENWVIEVSKTIGTFSYLVVATPAV